jgi:TonB family protein
MSRTALVVAVVLVTTLSAQQPYTPARYAGGPLPAIPALAVGGGQAVVEVTIRPDGSVQAVRPLRATPPFTQGLIDAVTGWHFTPAVEDAIGADGKPEGPRPVASKVIVASLFRPPTLVTPTLGEQPKNVGAASADVAYPTSTQEPQFPPKALFGGVVLIEVLVDATGRASEPRVIMSAPPFDQPALDAARQWRFRPARLKGRAAATYAYLVFGFPQPITAR